MKSAYLLQSKNITNIRLCNLAYRCKYFGEPATSVLIIDSTSTSKIQFAVSFQTRRHILEDRGKDPLLTWHHEDVWETEAQDGGGQLYASSGSHQLTIRKEASWARASLGL